MFGGPAAARHAAVRRAPASRAGVRVAGCSGRARRPRLWDRHVLNCAVRRGAGPGRRAGGRRRLRRRTARDTVGAGPAGSRGRTASSRWPAGSSACARSSRISDLPVDGRARPGRGAGGPAAMGGSRRGDRPRRRAAGTGSPAGRSRCCGRAGVLLAREGRVSAAAEVDAGRAPRSRRLGGGDRRGSSGAGSASSTRRARWSSWSGCAAPDSDPAARAVGGRADGRRRTRDVAPRGPGRCSQPMFHVKHRPHRLDADRGGGGAGRPGAAPRPAPDAPARRTAGCSPWPTRRAASARRRRTVNIAVALALHGLHVLVIDLDPQGNASTALGVEHRAGTPSVYEVLLGEITAGRGGRSRARPSPNLLLRPGHHRPGRRRDRARHHGRPGSTRLKQALSPRRSTSSTSTTSSSTARRRSACSRSTRWSPPTRC